MKLPPISLNSFGTSSSHQRFFSQFESIWIPKDYLSKRGTTAGIVDDVFDDTSKVAVAFTVVKSSESGWILMEEFMLA